MSSCEPLSDSIACVDIGRRRYRTSSRTISRSIAIGAPVDLVVFLREVADKDR